MQLATLGYRLQIRRRRSSTFLRCAVDSNIIIEHTLCYLQLYRTTLIFFSVVPCSYYQ